MRGKDIPDEIGELVMANIVKQDDGCWICTWPSNTPNMYVYVKGHLAHRASFSLAHGRQVEHGMVIDHRCFNRKCVNPDHLRELSRRENSARKVGNDWPLGYCKWGHPDSDRVAVHWKSRKVRTECSTCRKEINAANSNIATALRHLERAYFVSFTPKQRAMIQEFMPEHELAA